MRRTVCSTFSAKPGSGSPRIVSSATVSSRAASSATSSSGSDDGTLNQLRRHEVGDADAAIGLAVLLRALEPVDLARQQHLGGAHTVHVGVLDRWVQLRL